MTDEQALSTELDARLMAHGCSVYAPGKGVPEGKMLYEATRSGQRSAACGDRWMAARNEIKVRGLTPLPLPK